MKQPPTPIEKTQVSSNLNNVPDIEQWIMQEIAGLLRLSMEQLKKDVSLTRHGFDSIKVMRLAHQIEEKFTLSIPDSFFFKIDTINDLIEGIQGLINENTVVVTNNTKVSSDVPLSHTQQRVWFLYQVARNKSLYNISVSIEIAGALDKAALLQSIRSIQNRHHILKTHFFEKDGVIFHRFQKDQSLLFEDLDISTELDAEKDEKLKTIQYDKSHSIFNLLSGPCWSSTLVKTDAKTHHLIIVIHHIIADGWSLNVFIEEVKRQYFLNGQGASNIPPLRYQYTDLIEHNPSIDPESLEYWRSIFSLDDPINLPTDYIRPSVQTFRGKRYPLRFTKKTTDLIQSLAHKEDVTPFTYLMTVFNILLFRYTRQDLVKVGIAVANRDSIERSEQIGLFMDSIPVVTQLDDCPFTTLLKRVHHNLKNSIYHKDVPFIEIVKSLNVKRDLSRSPLFQVMFIYQNAVMEPVEIGDLVFHPQQIDLENSKFDLTLELYQGNNGIDGWFEYNCDLFTQTTLSRMADQFSTLVESSLFNSDQSIESLNIHSRKELDEILYSFNHTTSNYNQNAALPTLFEEQVVRSPDKIALVYNQEELTYKELNEKVNAIAHLLIKQNLSNDSPVGIYLERNTLLVASILAVLKVGLSFVPIDPIYPKQRIQYMLEDAGISTLISSQMLASALSFEKGIVIDLAKEQEAIAQQASQNPGIEVNGSNIAYIIYTSGSTGKPKGVVISHSSLANFLHAMEQKPGMTGSDVVLAVTTISFDISLLELFLPLVTGAKIVLASREASLSGKLLIKLLNNKHHPITFMQATPSTWKMIINSGWQGSSIKALCGGEALPETLAREILNRSDTLWNMYGPTETTVWSSVAEVKPGFNKIVIGSPIANTSLYILDVNNRIVPCGVPGELCIGGDGLAIGYLNLEQLTNERFIKVSINGKLERVYKTGDLVRYTPDGVLDIIGRLDDQVKIRGYRIELGDIETVVKSDNKIKDCVVYPKEVLKDETSLVCYYLADSEFNSLELKKGLKEKLPDYMIPSYFVKLEKFPTTPAGKTDKKNLPLPTRKPESSKPIDVTSYSSETEAIILQSWQEILERKTISNSDNFFDIGGHSLLMGRLHTKLEKVLNIEFELLDLFKHPTIKAQTSFFLNAKNPDNHKVPLDDKESSGSRTSIWNQLPTTSQDIAIVSMVCRLPGAESEDDFWTNLKEGKETISFFSKEESLSAGITEEDLADKTYVPAEGIIEDIELFDNDFFNMTPKEAEITDPQIRLFLESAWHALEKSGYDAQRYDGRIGVFAGGGLNAYLVDLCNNKKLVKSIGEYQLLLANDKDFISTKTAYHLDLKGPGVTLQTACSSSLTAVHYACRSLMHNECDMALAGGVSIRTPQKRGYFYREGMILSPDGHCRAFDEKAGGTVLSSGLGIVVLKRLEDAQVDRDNVLAVIKGTAINNDGALKAGFTAPSMEGQVAVIREALENAQLRPGDIDYIEAHGTGTQMGDPIEIAALSKVFPKSINKKIYIGSVKSNIGHTDIASGVAGLIKTVLALQNRSIPPSLHFTAYNPKMKIDRSSLVVNDRLRKWENSNSPRRAGVSSFGIGGTNVHVVLEEASPNENDFFSSGDEEVGRPWHLLPVSAKSKTSCEIMQRNLHAFLEDNSGISIVNAAYTLAMGRREFTNRRFAIGCTKDSGTKYIRDFEYRSKTEDSLDKPKLVFMFPGEGSEYADMAHELYKKEPVFQKRVTLCLSLFQEFSKQDFSVILYPKSTEQNSEDDRIHHPLFAQAALFTVEYALAGLLEHWGIHPHLSIGQNLGEYACAVLSGKLELEEAVKTIVNEAEKVTLKSPDINTSSRMSVESPEFLNQINHPAQFSQGIQQALESGECVFFEVGPGNHLCQEIKHIASDQKVEAFPLLKCFNTGRSDYENLLEAMGKWWCMGGNIHWEHFSENLSPGRVRLPTYVFNRKPFWLEYCPQPDASTAHRSNEIPTPKEKDVSKWFYSFVWKQKPLISPLVTMKNQSDSGWRLVFCGNDELSATFICNQQKKRVILVKEGDGFRENGANSYIVNPSEKSDFDLLARALVEKEIRIEEVVHFWSTALHGGFENETVRQRSLVYHGLLYFICSFNNVGFLSPYHIYIVSDRLFDVIGSEEIKPEKSILLGLAKVAPQEYPHINCTVCDVDLTDNHLGRIAERLLEEIRSNLNSRTIAIRRDKRWIRVVEPDEIRVGTEVVSRLKRGGVYLILGGLGKLGRSIARYLMSEFDAHVILTSRKGSVNEFQEEKIPIFENLSVNKEKLSICSANLADPQAMNQVVEKIYETHGQLNGVFHTAGIVGEDAVQTVEESTVEFFEKQFKAKVDGLYTLKQILRGRKIDFCLLSSSLTSVLGGIGVSAYTAVNCFMDAFAQCENRAGTISYQVINWDAWQDKQMDAQGMKTATLTRYSLDEAEAFQVLDFVFGNTSKEQWIVSTGDLKKRVNRLTAASSPDQNTKFAKPTECSKRTVSIEYKAPRNDIEQLVAEIWAEMIGIDKIGVDDNFFELGGHSLLAVQIISRLRNIFQIDVPLQEFFNIPNIDGVTKKIIELWGDRKTVEKIVTLYRQVEKMDREEN